jgi:hypothetical protein
MDRYDGIIAAIPGLARKLEEAGVDDWLARQPTQAIGSGTFFRIADRFVTRAEKMIEFAELRGLVTPDELRAADATQPLPSDVESVEVDTPRGDE